MRSKPGALERLMRFFCGRRGAALSRALLTVWAVVGPLLGAGFIYVGNAAYTEFKELRKGITAIQLYVASDDVRGAVRDERLVETVKALEGAKTELRARLDRLDNGFTDHDRRLVRVETRIERTHP